MESFDTIIAVLGWEDRFMKGLEYDFQYYSFRKLLLLRYPECNSMTEENKTELESICEKKKISFEILEISDVDTISKWKKMEEYFSIKENVGDSVFLEISTMPRDTIWTLLHFLKPLDIRLNYMYHTPQSYNADWLTKEPGEPRLLFKHSGVSKLGLPTALVILTGFEIERTKQLVYFFEPKITLLGLQKGNQFDNENRNVEMHNSIKGYTNTVEFELDAYSQDNGFSAIKNQIDQLKDDYNVLVTSIGPKPTAIALYRVYLDNPDIGLVYVPVKEFNQDYSNGIDIDNRIFGEFHYLNYLDSTF